MAKTMEYGKYMDNLRSRISRDLNKSLREEAKLRQDLPNTVKKAFGFDSTIPLSTKVVGYMLNGRKHDTYFLGCTLSEIVVDIKKALTTDLYKVHFLGKTKKR
jgi:hypothetical protein